MATLAVPPPPFPLNMCLLSLHYSFTEVPAYTIQLLWRLPSFIHPGKSSHFTKNLLKTCFFPRRLLQMNTKPTDPAHELMHILFYWMYVCCLSICIVFPRNVYCILYIPYNSYYWDMCVINTEHIADPKSFKYLLTFYLWEAPVFTIH